MRDLKQTVNHTLSRAREMLEGGFFTPHLVTFDADDHMAMVIIHADSRAGMIAAARTVVEKTDTEICLMVHECWIAREEADKPSGLMPSQHPDRIDALVVYGETRAGESEMVAAGVKEQNGRVKTYDLPGRHGGTGEVHCTWNLFSRVMN